MKLLKKFIVFSATLLLLGGLVSTLPNAAVEGQNLPPGERSSGTLYDGTNVTITGDQLLLPDGAKGAAALARSAQSNTGVYFTANAVRFATNGSNPLTLQPNQVSVPAGTAAVPIINFGLISGDLNTGVYRVGADNIGLSAGGALVMDVAATNAAGAGADLVTISATLGIMDGGDTVRGQHIDLANANHTGTGNTAIASDIDGIVPDAHATEIGQRIEGGFDLSAQFYDPVELKAYRQDFDGPCDKREAADYTAELVSDAGVNTAICDGGIKLFNYRLDGAQASPFIVVPGSGLDIDNDGANNEGVEIILADSATSTQGWSVVGTSPAMFVRVNLTITSVSGTDSMYVGWRLAEAFVDNLVLETYDTYGVYHINDNAGNIEIQTGDDGTDADDEDDQIATWSDAATHTLEVRVSTSGVFTFYIDDLPSTITQATGAAAAGDVLYPVIGLLNDSDADTELTINWIEVGEVL